MAQIGKITPQVSTSKALERARDRASLIPDLLVEARRVANIVTSGWHGRRKRGVGENFWQFRPYVNGESLARIDWRRSARDDTTYVRDMEWEAAHTVWIWADQSPSMNYQSNLAHVSKQSRALVLALALSEILSRSGERIAWPGLCDPMSARNAAQTLASYLSLTDDEHLAQAKPLPNMISNFCDIIIVSDFLDPIDEILAWLSPFASRPVRLHLIEVCDPAEEDFPYSGRTQFRDPKSDAKLTTGNAQAIKKQYQQLYKARRETLSNWAFAQGWSYTLNRTNELTSKTLVHVHDAMTNGSFTHGTSK